MHHEKVVVKSRSIAARHHIHKATSHTDPSKNKKKSSSEATSPRIGVIFTGEVRDVRAAVAVSRLVSGTDIFIGGYKKDLTFLNHTFPCMRGGVFVDQGRPPKTFPSTTNSSIFQSNMMQWYHLDNVISEFGLALSRCDAILKLRFDLTVAGGPPKIWSSARAAITSKGAATVFTESDKCFYAQSAVFLDAFRSYYENEVGRADNGADKTNAANVTGDAIGDWSSEAALVNYLASERAAMQHERISRMRPAISCGIFRGHFHKHGRGRERLFRSGDALEDGVLDPGLILRHENKCH